MTWSFSLVTHFFYAFPIDLKDAILKEGYKLPNIYLLTTKLLQATDFQKVREQTVRVHKILADESRRIKNYFHPIYILVHILILTMFTSTFPIIKLRLLSLSTLIFPLLLIFLNLWS